MDERYQTLIQQALDQHLVGWDFTWLAERTEEEPLAWDYCVVARSHMAGVNSMLDTGTGGGEVLASLAPFPPVVWATEGYPPNVIVARQRLEPLGVRIADTSGDGLRLPFEDNTFDLVINRHAGLPWSEIARVLRPGGRFVTQQVGGENCMEFNHYLQAQPFFIYSDWTLQEAIRKFGQAGLVVRSAQEAFPRWTIKDIAAVVFYLKCIPWQIEDFSVQTYQEKLYQLHQQIEQEGYFTVHWHRMLIEAYKPV